MKSFQRYKARALLESPFRTGSSFSNCIPIKWLVCILIDGVCFAIGCSVKINGHCASKFHRFADSLRLKYAYSRDIGDIWFLAYHSKQLGFDNESTFMLSYLGLLKWPRFERIINL